MEIKKILRIISLLALMISTLSLVAMEKKNVNDEIKPMVMRQFLEEAKKNNNWKTAFATAKHGQIVFMNVSRATNPNNEIGMEVHPFDQFILIVEGDGKAILSGKTSPVKSGDMIFIPQGTLHNVINLNREKELKVISFYSENDIPNGIVYKMKSDEPIVDE